MLARACAVRVWWGDELGERWSEEGDERRPLFFFLFFFSPPREAATQRIICSPQVISGGKEFLLFKSTRTYLCMGMGWWRGVINDLPMRVGAIDGGESGGGKH